MSAAMEAAVLWSAAKAAAERLQSGIGSHTISLGGLTVEQVHALAEEMGRAPVEQVTSFDDEDEALLLVSVFVIHVGVSISAQAKRPATAEDVRRLGGAGTYRTESSSLGVAEAVERLFEVAP